MWRFKVHASRPQLSGVRWDRYLLHSNLSLIISSFSWLPSKIWVSRYRFMRSMKLWWVKIRSFAWLSSSFITMCLSFWRNSKSFFTKKICFVEIWITDQDILTNVRFAIIHHDRMTRFSIKVSAITFSHTQESRCFAASNNLCISTKSHVSCVHSTREFVQNHQGYRRVEKTSNWRRFTLDFSSSLCLKSAMWDSLTKNTKRMIADCYKHSHFASDSFLTQTCYEFKMILNVTSQCWASL